VKRPHPWSRLTRVSLECGRAQCEREDLSRKPSLIHPRAFSGRSKCEMTRMVKCARGYSRFTRVREHGG
jgi:hypothetical protein